MKITAVLFFLKVAGLYWPGVLTAPKHALPVSNYDHGQNFFGLEWLRKLEVSVLWCNLGCTTKPSSSPITYYIKVLNEAPSKLYREHLL